MRKGINFRRPSANFPLNISKGNLKKTTAILQNRRNNTEKFIKIFKPPKNIAVKRKNWQILNIGRWLSNTPKLSPMDEGHEQPDPPEVRSRET